MSETVPESVSSAEENHRTKGLVRLTMACNERCPFCNVPAEDYPARPTPEAELLAEVDRFVAAGDRTLTISGGEPTLLRRRLLALTREARARGIDFVEIQTNAVLITPDYAAALAEAGVTMFGRRSPHGYAGTAVWRLMPSRSASGAISGIVTAAWPDPDGTKTLRTD